SERRRDRLEIDSKVRNLLDKLIKKMPSVVINYLLQYVYTVSLPESERSKLISMIMRAGSQLTEGNTKRAEGYVRLAVEKLTNHNIPLSPILVQLVDMYLLKMV
ncbi:MAG: hypothetical protein GWO20_01875, partial [Candidatus Korarchaeota archaeon]|nr:hypothetical protein [Candidatus Korarchaeota archaeon]NIU82267.1 hypothetical protein [Candidatus Thorarchaeota archaeon]NIW12721.1 hypothetical protein [Candidatus Thorarchaeota archaeon]NIW50932.1 hypothetical protein [Candidatus Korarchaeota archaeon]